MGDGNVVGDDVSSFPGALGRIYEEDMAAYCCRVRKKLCEESIRSKIRMRPLERVVNVAQLRA